ncbi:ATP-binding protein [Kitasatospora purpeofusca]|uniref:ATP-binding protein n=1 Tax=Kitasatospora purpeofusca TaxID=67352 RepID=UPI003865A487|nr:ATP-binding protein [Kitasatospora purpeofusca]
MRVCTRFFVVRDPASVRISRDKVAKIAATWGIRLDDGTRLALATVVSELVTNAVQHASGETLTIGVSANRYRERLLVEVYDESSMLPRPRTVGPDAESGRGMLLVERLARRHGSEVTEHGKRVWAELALPEQPLTRRELSFRPRPLRLCGIWRSSRSAVPTASGGPSRSAS